jgi:uncharacterized protein YbjT (DUF2867 family)
VSLSLITGASGNVGGPLTRRLIEARVRVRVGVRTPERDRWPAGVEAVRFDFDDPDSFAPALVGVERLFLLRPPAISDVASTLNPVVDAAIAAGVRQVVFLSVIGADRAKFIPHAKVEAHIRASAVTTWTFLRAGFFAQNLIDTYAPDIRDQDRIYLPAGSGKAAFVDADDLAEVAYLALVSPLDDPRFDRRAPSLTGPEALDFDEVAGLLSAELGREIHYRRASAFEFYRHLRGRGQPRAQALVVCALHVGLRFGQAERVDPTLASLLGRSPRDLADWIRRHRDAFIR